MFLELTACFYPIVLSRLTIRQNLGEIYIHRSMYVSLFIYSYVFVCVCVCVCAYARVYVRLTFVSRYNCGWVHIWMGLRMCICVSIIWKSHLTGKMKRSFLQAVVVSILLYGCTTWTLTKRLEEKLDVNYTRMLRAILNKSWWQHPTRHQLYSHLPLISKTIQVMQDTAEEAGTRS